MTSSASRTPWPTAAETWRRSRCSGRCADRVCRAPGMSARPRTVFGLRRRGRSPRMLRVELPREERGRRQEVSLARLSSQTSRSSSLIREASCVATPADGRRRSRSACTSPLGVRVHAHPRPDTKHRRVQRLARLLIRPHRRPGRLAQPPQAASVGSAMLSRTLGHGTRCRFRLVCLGLLLLPYAPAYGRRMTSPSGMLGQAKAVRPQNEPEARADAFDLPARRFRGSATSSPVGAWHR
jgi:hypothetical protein